MMCKGACKSDRTPFIDMPAEVILSGRSLYKSQIQVVLTNPCKTSELIFLHLYKDIWLFIKTTAHDFEDSFQ